MAKIGHLYKDENGKVFLAGSTLKQYDENEYVLCYWVELTDYDLRGANKAFKKIKKPFVLTIGELAGKELFVMNCDDCYYYEESCVHLGSPKCMCSCSQYSTETFGKYSQFVPDCRLFRDKSLEYNISTKPFNDYKHILDVLFEGCKFQNRAIYKNDIMLEAYFGCVGGILSEEQFQKVFLKHTDDLVIIIEEFPIYIDFKQEQKILEIPKEEFDYSFYLHKYKQKPFNVYLFEKSKVAIVMYFESVYLMSIDCN